MKEELPLNMGVVENEFESFISNSKLYISSREESEIEILKNHIEKLKLEFEQIDLENSENDITKKVALGMIKNVIDKFYLSVHLLDKIKDIRPVFKELDIQIMLDILYHNIKQIINYDQWPEKVDRSDLESDLETIECLEDQHKRVLMTYLMQDWDNLNEVLTLMKLGETYKSIAQELIGISLLLDGHAEAA